MTDKFKEMARMREQTNFLGFEFLTWLFLLIEHEHGRASLPAITKDNVALLFGNRVVTCLLNHKEQKTSIVSPLLEDSHEVFASLKNGHVIEALSLVVAINDIKISLMLHAQDFSFTQLKIHQDFEDTSVDDENARLSEEDETREEIFLRVCALRDVEAVVNGIFAHFCQLRFSDGQYKEQMQKMRTQIENRLGHYLKNKVSNDSRVHQDEHV